MGLVSSSAVDLIVLNRVMQLRDVIFMANVSGSCSGDAFNALLLHCLGGWVGNFRIRIEYILGLSATISIIEAPLVSHLNLPNFNLFVGSWYMWPTG